MDIILTHTHSDFDAIGASVAASKLYPGAIPVVHAALDGMVREYVAVHKDVLGFKHIEELDLDQVTRVIVVDTQTPGRLGKGEALLERPGIEWIVYDHHPTVEGDMPPTPGRRELIGSATTLLVQELEKRGRSFTPLEATTMALGVYVDTGSLTFPSTTPADARAVAYLLEHGADVQIISQYSQSVLGEAQQALLQALIDVSEPALLRGYNVLVTGTVWPEHVDGIALIVHKLIDLMSLDVVVVVVELEGKRTQFIARSRVQDVNVRKLLEPYGGRGHAQASSAHQKKLPLATALADMQARLPGLLPPEPTAADLMSAPVRTIPDDTSVEEAQRLLFRYGHNAFVVVDEGAITGLVSRRDLDRSMHHGLGHVPVKGIMSHRIIAVGPEAPLSEIEKLMIEHDIGRLPVLHGDALVGIVTRTDLLRVLYAHREAHRRAVRLTVTRITQLLREVWPKPWLELVEAIGEVAGERPLYLIGGAVRDLLLGQPNLDVDLVVEGDAIALAREIGEAFPGTEVSVHEKFGTARLTFKDGRKVDVATARTEFYEYPAALPTVEYSSIKHDLSRRDFSVNAMAIRLNHGHFGELLDFFSSRQDLERRVLRVLHNLSFIEDPTRLLRAVRFEQQLGFKLDRQSEAFARYAMQTGAFDGLGGERNKVELRRIFSLDNPLPAARRLGELDAWRLIHPAIAPDDETWCHFRRARRLFHKLRTEAPMHRWLTYMTIVLRPLPLTEIEAVLRKLILPRDQAAQVLEALAAESAIGGRSLAAMPPVELYHLLKPYPLPVLAYLAVLLDDMADRRALVRYWTDLRTTKLSVSGDDLRALGLRPGPHYGEILGKVLDARLGGELDSPERERAMLEHLARKALEAPP